MKTANAFLLAMAALFGAGLLNQLIFKESFSWLFVVNATLGLTSLLWMRSVFNNLVEDRAVDEVDIKIEIADAGIVYFIRGKQ